MHTFRCNGCPKGPHLIIALDPDFDPGTICIDPAQPGNTAVWRELVVSGE